MNKFRIIALGSALSLIPVTIAEEVDVTPVEALGGCTRVDGAQWTSGHCTTSGGAPFMHAEQTCVLNYYTYVVQRGPSVGQGGYSSAGPCTAPIVNRKLVQTTFP